MSLIVQDLDVSFGANTVISNLNFEMKSGDIVAIIGPSGCGKTTLLRAISGLLKPTKGTIVLDGENIDEWDGNAVDMADAAIYGAGYYGYFSTMGQVMGDQNGDGRDDLDHHRFGRP